MSIYETLHHGEHVYFDSAVMLMFFLLIGRYLDFRARNHARSSATNLLSTLTGFATVIGDNNKTRRILIRDLREDMHIRVMSGEKFPIDGEITEGQSTVDTSLVTGEGLPRNIHIGDMVYAGTLNLSAPITVKVAKAADNSLLSDIVRLMETAEQGQARYIRLADRAARLYTPIVHSMAAIAFLGWFFIGGLPLAQAVMIAVTVLIITCPCALGLAVPVVQVLASGQLFKNGILLKSGDALEKLAHVDVMMLDKTGTLTLGTPVLNNPSSYRNIDFQIAASLAAHSAHPLSKALLSAYKDQDKLLSLNNIKEVAGLGLRASYEGKTVKLGNRHWCGDKNAPPSEAPEIWLSYRNQEPVRFNFTDPLRSDCVDIIRKFKNENVRPIISSGDQENSVRNVANQCHIERYYSTQKPPEKFELMQQLKSEGHKILMVGDGLNDTPTLTGADVSIAPGTAIAYVI